jgi:protein tyrosine phosphatase
MNKQEDIIESVEKKRRKEKITIHQLCEQFNFSYTTYWRYKSGKQQMQLDTAIALNNWVSK